MHNVSLVTYPDFVSTGFQVVLINVEPEQQAVISNLLLDLDYPTNVYQIDLEVTDHLTYNLSALNLSDIIIFNKPNMWHWATGLALAMPRCFFIENDTSTVNTFNKLSLRHVKLETLKEIIKNGLQRKHQQQTDLQFLPTES
jgi:hypothetical protein